MTTSLLILARAFHFGSGMILVGVVAFRWLVLLPAFAGAGDEAWCELTPFLRRLHWLFVGAGVVLVLSGLALFWAVAAGMSGSSLGESLNAETLGTVFFQTQFGAVFQGRLGLVIFLGVVMGLLHRMRWHEQRRWSLLEGIAGMIALALLASLAGTGHAAASSDATLPLRIAVDALHLAVAAIWPTGLLPFALFLAQAARIEKNVAPAPVLKAVRRFSEVSLLALGFLVTTGVINACFLVGSFAALFATTYGQVLCLKLVLFGLMLGIAAWNRFRLLPLLFAESATGNVCARLRRLRGFVLGEAGLAVALIVVVSVLGTTPPPS